MTERYFVESRIDFPVVQLGQSEMHHLLHVMRAETGVEIILFDGSGFEYVGRVVKTGRNQVHVEVLSGLEVNRELRRTLVLAVALPRHDRQAWLVEKAVELGVRRLVPLTTARSVAKPSAGALNRLRRVVVESSKQCGRNCLMEIGDAQPFSQYLAQTATADLRWFLHPSESDEPSNLRALIADVWQANFLHAAIGPEGGFTEVEARAALDAGWTRVHLGTRILRVETAAIAVASLAAT